MKIICIVNNSRGSLEIDYPGGKLAIPGHCFESDPFCAEVPDEVVEGIIASVERQPAYVYMGGDVEMVETPDDGNLDGNPDDTLDGNSDDKDQEGNGDGKPDNPPPEKDEFMLKCSAKVVEGTVDTYAVTLPAGDVMTVTGVHHHMQAKSAAYNMLYGGSE